MDVKYINPLLQATTSVLTTMAGVEVEMGKPTLKNENNSLADVTGIIDLNGEQVTGWLALGFYEGTILKIAQNMLREQFDSIDDMVVDLVGELTNMITGSAKGIYSEKGYFDIAMALPRVVVGRDKILLEKASTPSILLPFSSSAGDFIVEFRIN